LTDSIGASPQAVQRAEVMAALKTAARTTGVGFDYLVKTAQRESNFDPNAKAGTSSATGLFQFTDATWMSMLERYGAKHGVGVEGQSRAELLALRKDAKLSSVMAGELAGENAKILQKKLGRPATSAELYTAHFMGPSDAGRLIQAARANRTGDAAGMFPSAAKANQNVFRGKDGANLTVAQLYVKLTGATIADADTGKVAPASLGQAPEPVTAADVLLQAQMGAVAMTSSLMTALFGLQEDKG
jgi:Transglycosylase SLT domain